MKGTNVLILLTEWNQFRRLDLTRVKKLLAEPIFFDLRNVYQKEEVENAGIEYIGVGVPENKIEEAKQEIASTEESD